MIANDVPWDVAWWALAGAALANYAFRAGGAFFLAESGPKVSFSNGSPRSPTP